MGNMIGIQSGWEIIAARTAEVASYGCLFDNEFTDEDQYRVLLDGKDWNCNIGDFLPVGGVEPGFDFRVEA